MKQLAKLLIGMCLFFVCSQAAFAVNYTTSVLNPTLGSPDTCYSYLTRTEATSPTFLGNGEEHVGVMCFDAFSNTMTEGHVRDTAGLTYTIQDCTTGSNLLTGAYGFAAANLPYYGGGWVSFVGGPAGCRNQYDIVVNTVNAGLAGGFQIIKRNPIYNPAGLVLGGTAFWQGPPTAYGLGVLNGCYSMLSESVLSSPTPSGPGKDLLGTVCFSAGSISFGRVRDLNGVITSINNPNGSCLPCVGTYTVPNSPGYGMGTMTFPGNLQFAFAPFGVGIPAAGVANGFQFVLIHPVSPAGSRIEGGTAYFQQP